MILSNFRTADGRRTAELTETTITVFEGGKIIAEVPATEVHREYPGTVWGVINSVTDPETIELAQMIDFIVSATTDVVRPAMAGLPVQFLTDRFTTDRALTTVANAYEANRNRFGFPPGRAAGLAGARLLRTTIAGVSDRVLIQVSRAVEAAYNSQRQH
ncbi:hypothetical protein ACFUTY_38790 [Streptomyces sp. NPDC057362]|uniref:hypothetical protein n=1 Tax=Streptomyces sp. NPDC057362 TaxID=3346106 RepID=UPI0036442FAE